MSIANMHLCAKNWKKLMMKSREMATKPVFPAFSAEKIRFSKIELGHILDIGILHQCAKFHEKIYSTARKIQEIPFFRRKSAVPANFRKFRLQKSV